LPGHATRNGSTELHVTDHDGKEVSMPRDAVCPACQRGKAGHIHARATDLNVTRHGMERGAHVSNPDLVVKVCSLCRELEDADAVLRAIARRGKLSTRARRAVTP